MVKKLNKAAAYALQGQELPQSVVNRDTDVILDALESDDFMSDELMLYN